MQKRREKVSASQASNTQWLPLRTRKKGFKHQKKCENGQVDSNTPDEPKGTVADYADFQSIING